MLTRNAFALMGAAVTMAFAMLGTAPAHAQTSTTPDQDDKVVEGQGRGTPDRSNRRGREAPAADPAAIMAEAQATATATNSPCQVTEATVLGDAPEGGKVYEASCATGPGYIFTASTPPSAIDCVILEYTLAKQAAAAPAATPEPARGRGRSNRQDVQMTGCKMPANLDTQAVLKAYATEAGVPCQTDQVAVVGSTTSTSAVIYEVGCPNADGYRISKEATGWSKTSCIEIVAAGGTCQFTTKPEQLATFKSWAASNADAAACDPADIRYMGANDNGSFYEAKCTAGNGVIVRFDTTMAAQQVYPCETAQRVGGGCKLTVVPDAPATEATPAPAAAPAT